MKEFVLDILAVYFQDEISNVIICNENEIIVLLADGSKAKIATKKIA